jgi:Spy/CpxP family protein refolding chaperone
VVAPGPGGGEVADAEEHRRHHGGGISMLIVMSIRDLDLSADQHAAVDKIHSELMEKMATVRAADRELATVLADGVAAGAVDKAKADKAVDKVVAQAQKVREATGDAIGRLHDALTQAQRAELIDKLQAHFDKWKAAHGQDESEDKEHRSGHLLALVRDLSLSQDEAQKIKAAFKAQMKAGGKQDHEHKEVQDHLKAFEKAFKADKWDPKAPSSAGADKHMARFAASRRAMFFEAAAPILTPDQRTKLAQMIRPDADESAK